MARLLKDLKPGTPVHSTDRSGAAQIRGLFASGDGDSVQYVLVAWSDTGDETLLDAKEILRIDDGGAHLGSQRAAYRDMPAYDPTSNPLLRRL